MLHFFEDTKIYVHCPSGVVTGGAELLHQLVSFLRENDREAYIVYFSETNSNESHFDVPSDYKGYTIAQTSIIDDKPHNIEVFYEGIFDRIGQYKNTQKFLWWISVDNFFYVGQRYIALSDLWHFDKQMAKTWLLRRCKRLLLKHRNEFKSSISIKSLVQQSDMCGFQAEYIQDFLRRNGFKELAPLKDYINTDHCKPIDVSRKNDMVLYNPRKGIDFTRKLIESAPDIQWVALQGFSRNQLIEVLRDAKVYIDFGNHPGKDRLPRECAMNGCCVITGNRGSAAFFEDVSIPSEYHFDENKDSVDDIIKQIRYTLANYESCVNDFAYYRKCIMSEKAEFEQQIKNLFLLK